MARARTKSEARQFNEALGRRIAGARAASGLKCKELAKSAGISASGLYSYEAGLTNCPPIILARIARALQVPVASLLPKFGLGAHEEKPEARPLKSTPNSARQDVAVFSCNAAKAE